jgi:hypothetical protein
MQRNNTNTLLKTGVIFKGSSLKSYMRNDHSRKRNILIFPNRRWHPPFICLSDKSFSKRGALHYSEGLGSLYFNFHQKWSKLGTILQTGSNEAETKKNCKFMTVRPVIGPSFYFWQCILLKKSWIYGRGVEQCLNA